MADEIKLKAPTVEQQVVVNINGEDKLKSFADTLDKISNNKNLQKYWKTQQDLINATTDAYNNFQKKASKDNAFELIKVTNALKAMSGIDLSHILPDFDKISKGMAEAQKVAGNIDSAFSVKGFKEAFDSFETLKAYGTDIQKLFSHFGVSSDIGELQQNVRLLEGEVEKLTRRLSNARNANEELRNEFENFKVGSGFADKLDELDRLKAEMQNIRNEAIVTFNQFLEANKIDKYDWFNNDRFAEYFEKLENGTLTASEAIRQFKTEYDYLLEESFKSNGNSFGLDQLQAFSTKLDSIFQQVEETSNKINDILSNGVIAKSVQNLSEDTTLSDSQRSIFGNILQDEESLKSVTALFQKLIDETNQTKNTEVFNTEQFTKLESLFTSIESSLSSIKGVLVDVGDGEELSPLLKTINNIEVAVDRLSSSVKGIGLNMNIDFGSDTELEAKAEAKISNALQAYQNLFEHIKMSSAGGSLITQKFFDFDINQFDTPMSKLQAYIKFIKDMREETKKMFGGQDILKIDTDDKYWNRASAAMGQVKKTFNEMKATNDTNPLENIFGKTDLSGVIEQLNTIASKLDEISVSTKEFTETFKNGLNVNASVEEIEKLTNKVKELEDELARVKAPTTLPSEESNTLSGSSQVKISDNITDQIIKNEKKKQDAYKATTEMVMYHAGIISKLNKAETNGQFYGSDRNTGYFGTGHYFVDANTKHELDDNDYYSSLPYTSIDISKYDNLFKATTDEIANALHTFLKNLTQFTQGSDLFDISELFSQFQKVFGESTMDMQEFDEKLSYLKTYMQNSDMFDRGDSVSTQFMKSLGYGGVDTRGTNYADTRYGTVIYDLKEESILQSNITDELQKQGQMLEKINYEKGQVFDKSEDAKIQSILDQQAKSKEIEAEFNKIFDSTNLNTYENELESVNQKLSENQNIIDNCNSAIKLAEEDAREYARDMAEIGKSISDEKLNEIVKNNKVEYQERIEELSKEQSLLKDRKQEIESNLDAEYKLANAARERATATVEDRMKDAFPDSSTNTKPETEGMEQVEKATKEAVQAKKDFATANEGVQSSIDGSENPLKLEAELMEQIARSAREAADAKKEFVKANKQVKDSANKSNNDLVDGHSENAEPSGVKKYKKKGYKAHDTGNHDNEKKVSNKAELEQALRELQSEIIASIDESTSFVKEITDFYDSQNDLVKTQTKVGDKNGGVRTYTHSYSTDKEGNTTAWTSHIDSKKYQDQNKIIQEQIKNLQKLSAEKQKAAESERKSTVNKASKDQLEAWKQIQRIRKEIANTSNAKLVDQLEQEKKTYQEQFLTATKILKNNSDLYNSEQRLNELKKISLKTTQQIESTQQRQLNGYDNKLSGYQGKISGYKATIDKFGDDGWTSPEYSDNVQRAQQALKAYEDEVNKLKANPDLINKESLANVEKLGKDFEEATLAIKNMTAAQKGYTQLGAEKAMDKISQMLKENSKMSRQAKADIKAWYDQIKSGNPSASLDVILGKVEEIVRKEKEAGRGGKSMWDAIKEKAFYSAASVVGTYFGLNDIIRYGKEGIDIVRELDAAMTEVRKVSNATEGQYKSFRNTISSTAKEIATTNKELLNSSADFLRLGYSLDQASDLAKNATLFVNVGDGVDITEATEDMITAMKAFDIQAEDSIKIVDDYNQIGNQFALSATDIGEAMKRSASALETGNNSFEESIALITAMNEIVQNSENTGNTLKVFSLRLRGAKAELEDMGEDTDGLCESTSKLREQLKSLTGVDIMLNDNTFKSTTQIVKELGATWDKLSDSSQAATLELVAGKTRANNVAALLKNYQKIDDVMESLGDAEGSALKENAAIVDSIDGRIKVLSATAEDFWQKFIDTDLVKDTISSLSGILNLLTKIIDKVGLLPTLLTPIGAIIGKKLGYASI